MTIAAVILRQQQPVFRLGISGLVSRCSSLAAASRPQPTRASSSAIRFQERRLIGYSQQQIFDVVADIDKYMEFLPWCRKSRVLTKMPGKRVAELEIGFSAVREQYKSVVTLKSPNMIHAVSDDSRLFRQLVNYWHFEPGPEVEGGPTTYVDVKVVFDFRNPMHSLLAGAALDKVSRRMIQAFEDRCFQVYGRGAVIGAGAASSSH